MFLIALTLALGVLPLAALCGFRLGLALHEWAAELSADVHANHS